MYIYKLKNGKELCRSASPIEFSDLFPQFKDIKPEQVKAARQKETKDGK